MHTSSCALQITLWISQLKKLLEEKLVWFLSLRGWGKANNLYNIYFLLLVHLSRCQWKVTIEIKFIHFFVNLLFVGIWNLALLVGARAQTSPGLSSGNYPPPQENSSSVFVRVIFYYFLCPILLYLAVHSRTAPMSHFTPYWAAVGKPLPDHLLLSSDS